MTIAVSDWDGQGAGIPLESEGDLSLSSVVFQTQIFRVDTDSWRRRGHDVTSIERAHTAIDHGAAKHG